MSWRRLRKFQAKRKQQVAPYTCHAISARSSGAEFHSASFQLQRVLGNRRVAQLIQAKRLTPEGKIIGFQRKQIVSTAHDQYEQEADRVARQVMNTPNALASHSAQRAISSEEDKDQMLQTKELAASITPFVQRQMETNQEWKEKEMPIQPMFAGTSRGQLQRQPKTDEDETKPVQAKSSGSMTGSFEAGEDIESQVSQSKAHGNPLPEPVRSFMEPRFGVDFSHVRVHTGSDAIQMNRDVGAKAFTHGSDIYYGAGNNPTNLELTAHELTHVIQQTGSVPLQTKLLDESTTSGSERSLQRACSACGAEKEKIESDPRSFSVQRTIGDGHDFPPASRFSGNATLEGVFDNERVLQVGSTGAPVTLVQQALIALGYPLPRFGADGNFGDETKRAVNAFQRDVGLTPDGRVGFRTIDFLDKRDRGVEVAPPVRPVVANAPFNVANAIAQPGAAPSNALGGGIWGLTFPESVQVTIDVFNNGGVWQPVLTGVIGNYSLQTRLLPGRTEVTGPGGNTTAANYCAQINDLNSLNGAAWYMLSAVLAHERVHARQFRTALIHPSVITPLETAIEAITIPVSFLTPVPGAAEFFIRLNPAFTAALNAAQANWLARILVLVAGDHTPGGRTDTEEHAIVDPMRRRICQHARANGWPACPPLCP
jgi:peptidoglycan hydrolase-like protein with peptidoglycan-binding domain